MSFIFSDQSDVSTCCPCWSSSAADGCACSCHTPMPLSAYSRKLTITLDDLRELQPMLDVSRRMAVAAARKLNREVFAALVAPGGCPIPGVRIDPEPMAFYSLKLSEPYRHGIVTLNPEDLP